MDSHRPKLPVFNPKARLECLFLISAILLLPAAAQRAARDKPSDHPADSVSGEVPKYSAEVKVVNLLATVRDKHGHILSDLSKDDFVLQEDGRPQVIKYFTQETNLPLKLGLLVDTSGSVLSVLDQERTASESFLEQVLREEMDSAFVIHFDRQVELLQDVTQSRQKLESAIAQIAPSERDQQTGGGWPGRGGGGHHGGGGGAGTLLYDAVYLASDELMQKQQGRKALILLTDGDDRGSKTSLAQAIEYAQRADTLVYCIYFKGEESSGFSPFGQGRGGYGRGGMGRGGAGRFPESHEDGKKVLQRIAKETGGRMFEVSKKEPIEQIYAQIQEELRNQYSLGYTPDRTGGSSAYHKIHLAAKRQDGIVQTRDGYYD